LAGEICSLPKIPYKHFVTGLSPETAVAELVQTHSKLLRKTRAALDEAGATDYNLVFTHSWMMMIPRRHAGRDGVCANAAGMVGMVWVKHQEERDAWTTKGLSEFLAYLGIPAVSG
jgi:ATP adenylyltransferase/5',5'''-P-1,P-4-tetraphosphate phosphorylase II